MIAKLELFYIQTVFFVKKIFYSGLIKYNTLNNSLFYLQFFFVPKPVFEQKRKVFPYKRRFFLNKKSLFQEKIVSCKI